MADNNEQYKRLPTRAHEPGLVALDERPPLVLLPMRREGPGRRFRRAAAQVFQRTMSQAGDWLHGYRDHIKTGVTVVTYAGAIGLAAAGALALGNAFGYALSKVHPSPEVLAERAQREQRAANALDEFNQLMGQITGDGKPGWIYTSAPRENGARRSGDTIYAYPVSGEITISGGRQIEHQRVTLIPPGGKEPGRIIFGRDRETIISLDAEGNLDGGNTGPEREAYARLKEKETYGGVLDAMQKADAECLGRNIAGPNQTGTDEENKDRLYGDFTACMRTAISALHQTVDVSFKEGAWPRDWSFYAWYAVPGDNLVGQVYGEAENRNYVQIEYGWEWAEGLRIVRRGTTLFDKEMTEFPMSLYDFDDMIYGLEEKPFRLDRGTIQMGRGMSYANGAIRSFGPKVR